METNHFNQCLILGLKSALIEADTEIRQLKEKLLAFILKFTREESVCMELKTKFNDAKTKFNKSISNLQTEVNFLKKELQDKENENVNLNFKTSELKALIEMKVREIEILKSEGMKLHLPKRNEYRYKYRELKRKLKVVWKKLKEPDSNLLILLSNLMVEIGEESEPILNYSYFSDNNGKFRDIQLPLFVSPTSPVNSPSFSSRSVSDQTPSEGYSSVGDDFDESDVDHYITDLVLSNRQEIETELMKSSNKLDTKVVKQSVQTKLPDVTKDDGEKHNEIIGEDFVPKPSITQPKFGSSVYDLLPVDHKPKSISAFDKKKQIQADASTSYSPPFILLEKVESTPKSSDEASNCALVDKHVQTDNIESDSLLVDNGLESVSSFVKKKQIQSDAGTSYISPFILTEKEESTPKSSDKQGNCELVDKHLQTDNTEKIDLKDQNVIFEDECLMDLEIPIIESIFYDQNVLDNLVFEILDEMCNTRHCIPFELYQFYEENNKICDAATYEVTTKIDLQTALQDCKQEPKPMENSKKSKENENYFVQESKLKTVDLLKELITQYYALAAKTDELTRFAQKLESEDIEGKYKPMKNIEKTQIHESILSCNTPINVERMKMHVDEFVTENGPLDPKKSETTVADTHDDDDDDDGNKESVVPKVSCRSETYILQQEHTSKTREIIMPEEPVLVSVQIVEVQNAEDVTEYSQEDNFEETCASSDAEEDTLVIAEYEVAVGENKSNQMNGSYIPGKHSMVSTKETILVEKEKSITEIVAEPDPQVSRYNLRSKPVVDFSCLAKGIVRHKRRITELDKCSKMAADVKPLSSVANLPISHTDSYLPASDRSKSVDTNAFSSLSDQNCTAGYVHDEIESHVVKKKKLCVPNFYVENTKNIEQSHQEKFLTRFDEVWNHMKYMRIPNWSDMSEKVDLGPVQENVLKSAFVRRMIRERNRTTHEKLRNLNVIEKAMNGYFDDKKIALSEILPKITCSNKTTCCRALETLVIKQYNKSKATGNLALFHQSLDFFLVLTFEIDQMERFEGFVDSMRQFLKSKIFVKISEDDENLKGQNMTCNAVLLSTCYARINKAKGNVNDTLDFLYESLMSFRNRAHPIAFGILSGWPDVFKWNTSKSPILIEIMLFCLVHHKMKWNNELFKVPEVQQKIKDVYNVRLEDKTAEDHAREAMIRIGEKYWVEAIVLLCKRQLFKWAYTDVIMKYFVPLLRIWNSQNACDAILVKILQALDKIMMSCPRSILRTSTFDFKAIVDALASILQGEKGSRHAKETVCIIMCRLSTWEFSSCSTVLMSWMPVDRLISEEVLDKMCIIMKKGMYANWLAYLDPCRYQKQVETKQLKIRPKSNEVGRPVKKGTQNKGKGSKKGKKKKKKTKKNNFGIAHL